MKPANVARDSAHSLSVRGCARRALTVLADRVLCWPAWRPSPGYRVRTPARRRAEERGLRATSAGFFGSASRLPLLPGGHIDSAGVRGYYIDLSMKPVSPTWPPSWFEVADLHVVFTQWGLGCYERYLDGAGDQWLNGALACGRHLLSRQDAKGAFPHLAPYPHTFSLLPPWVSGIAQGQAASLFMRLYAETGDNVFAENGRLALAPLLVPTVEGGAGALLDAREWPEEYPTDPPSFVLNGGIFAMWGYRDVAAALDDAVAGATFERAVDTLAGTIHRWDTGFWSRYDLYPHPLANVASFSYHVLHISQLRVLNELAPRPALADAVARFESYWSSRVCRARAFAHKAAFRLRVPRRS